MRRTLAATRVALPVPGPRTFVVHALASAAGILLIQAGRERTKREGARRRTAPRIVEQ